MSGQTHTPGPWACEEVRTQVGRAFRIGAGEMLVPGKGCCIIYDDYPGNPDNERAANARLIAAAPELLEALKRLMTAERAASKADREAIVAARFTGPDQASAFSAQDGAGRELTAAWEVARAAIAKATGQ